MRVLHRVGRWVSWGVLFGAGCAAPSAVVGDTSNPVLGTWVWGDLHAHSNWSYDGCEDPDAWCAPRGETPASDFYANALDAGLDFAALTDHAEADLWFPNGVDGSEGREVWRGQRGVVRDAEGGAVLPVLGYEWTAYRNQETDGRPTGGHRTVLLDTPDACPEYRVHGRRLPEGQLQPELSDAVYVQREATVAEFPAELWAALDAAADSCGGRWISYAHHSAYETPQEVDWFLPENAPDRERLVEIYSEHGSSECADPELEGCDWQRNDAQVYYPDGSVQTALGQGFRLGFVGGTDGHDARPGSIFDGPSTVAHWVDEDGDGVGDVAETQFAPGGLTGVQVRGDLTVSTLFDGLDARRTMATSGPTPEIELHLLGRDGFWYPPGAEVPVSLGPFKVRVGVELPDDVEELVVELVGPGGQVLQSGSGERFEETWAPVAGDWAYVRLRLLGPGASEDRIWASPWFIDPAGAGCRGCASASVTFGDEWPVTGIFVGFLAALLLWRRSDWAG